MDLSRLVHNYRPSGVATIKGGIVAPRRVPVPVGDSGSRPASRQAEAASEPQRQDIVDNLSAPPAIDEGSPDDTPAADPEADSSSSLSYLSSTPSLPPEAAERLTATPARPRPQLHIQARLAQIKTELARVYQTKDRTTPLNTRNRPSLIVGPFVRFMARVYTKDIEDVRIQRHLREQVMTPAHFRELMIWHARAVRERERKSGAGPTPRERERQNDGPAPRPRPAEKAPSRTVKRKSKKK